MWRIDRTDWPYYSICCCCLNKPDTWEEDLTESTLLESVGWEGFSDRCNDNDVYARIILPLRNHYTCGVTPGVTATRWGLGPRLICCETQFCGEEPDHRYHNVSRSTSTQSPNAGPGLPSSHTWGQYLAGGWLQSIFVHRLRKHSLYKPLDANYFRINWWLHNSNTHSIEN